MIVKNSITRAANTDAYSAGDVINASGSTTPILLEYEGTTRFPFALFSHLVSSNEAGTPAVDVYLFSNTFTIAADNAAFAPTDSQMKDYYLGKISHSDWTAFAANKHSDAKPDAPIAIPTQTAPNTGVYVVLVATGAYTPVSGEVITIKLDVD